MFYNVVSSVDMKYPQNDGTSMAPDILCAVTGMARKPCFMRQTKLQKKN